MVAGVTLAWGCGSTSSNAPHEGAGGNGAAGSGGDVGGGGTDAAAAGKTSAMAGEGGAAGVGGVNGGEGGAGGVGAWGGSDAGGVGAWGGSDAGGAGASGGSDAGGAAGSDSVAAAGAGGSDGGPVKPPTMRRLPVPCEAPLPTGFCLVSDEGDWVGGGQSSSAGGDGSVTLYSNGSNGISADLTNAANGDYWFTDFAAPNDVRMQPGLYDPAERYPFQSGLVAGLSVVGNGAGCNTITGKFSVEELKREPGQGVTVFSVTFEQHCEGDVPALRGVINFAATGTPDPTPEPDDVIELSGKVFRVAYEPSSNIAYGIDATNRRLAKIDLSTGDATYADVVQVPNDICVDTARGRLFVVDKGSSLISEYLSSDLSLVRDINWAGTDWGVNDTHFKIYCAPQALYVVDGAWAPVLFTVQDLDTDMPVVTDHGAQVSGVGGLVLNSAQTNFYYWYQYGWSAGLLSTSVRRVLLSDFSQIDQTLASVPDFNRNPLDAPILLDEGRGLIFNKSKILDWTNLEKLIYTLPGGFDSFDGAEENAYALSPENGLLSTKNFIYELVFYDPIAETLDPTANQLFFDASGKLWYLSVPKGTLESQLP